MKRRKVGNMLALAILSVLSTGAMHPYQIASGLRERGKDRDMTIKWGTFYTVVGNLGKHGFIEATENARDGGRPERTVYAITDAGRDELADWIRELLAEPDPQPTALTAALSVMATLGPDEVAGLLQRRVATLAEQIGTQRADLAGYGVPRLFLIEGEYNLAMQEAELAWTRSFLAELTTGTLPDLDAWRHFHATGEVPDGLMPSEGTT